MPSQQVNWNELEHATGPATRVPAQIRELARDDTASALEAYRVLDETLYAPGVWTEAGAHAVPLLFEVASGQSRYAYRALWLVANVLAGAHLSALEGLARADAEEPALATRKAVLARAETLFDMAERSTIERRSAAVFVLAFLPELRTRSVPLLEAIATAVGEDGALRACAALSLGTLRRVEPSVNGCAVLVELARSDDALVRMGAALGLAITRDVDAVRELQAPLSPRLAAEIERNESFPWFSGNLDAGVFAIAKPHAPHERSRFGLWLASAIPASGPLTQRQRQVWPASALLLASFELPWTDDDYVEIASVGPEQRAVIAALDHPDLELLETGLPAGLRERRRWLGLDRAGPLERMVSVHAEGTTTEGPLWQLWRRIYRDELDDAFLPAVIAARLTPLECVWSLVEIDYDAYELLALTPNDWEIEEFEALIARAGADLLPWAEAFADEMAAFVARSNDPNAFRPAGLELGVLLPLARTKRSFKPAWDILIDETSGHAREILSALSSERREQLVFERLGPEEMPWYERCAAIVPVLDLVPSKRIAEKLTNSIRNERDRFETGKAHEDAVKLLARIEEVGTKEPEVQAGYRAGMARR